MSAQDAKMVSLLAPSIANPLATGAGVEPKGGLAKVAELAAQQGPQVANPKPLCTKN